MAYFNMNLVFIGYQKSLAIREALSAADPLNAQFLLDLYRMLNHLAELSAKADRVAEARSYTVQLLSIQKAQADRPKATAAERIASCFYE